MKTVLVLLALALAVSADVYLHSPRGSNNRCDGQGNDRNGDEDNRLFNSQNNDAGGYTWGPALYYYAGSLLSVEWTNQHACGGNGKLNCEVVMQYMCDDSIKDGQTEDPSGENGGNTCTQQVTEDNYEDPNVGMHENLAYFQACNARDRNTNLFTSNQNLNNNAGAQATRQNAGGGQSGFECQEERDYYPYWHPTPWIDIAILTTNQSRCSWYQDQSENVLGRNFCTDPEFNNEDDCTAQAGASAWQLSSSHRSTYGRLAVDAPICDEAPWSRDNHLGSSIDGYMATFNWTIPNNAQESCVFRLRYNISTNDYDSWNTDASRNGNNGPISNDPVVMYGSIPVRLAIATNQFGRTFEDRTHTFEIRSALSAGAGFLTELYNLNVRGKRGNIAQVRNCMEYDFVPERLHAAVGDHVHIQWTGSNHNNAGNAGNGRTRTDRSNIVPLINNDMAASYPENVETQRMFSSVSVAEFMANIGQNPPGGCFTYDEAENGNDQDDRNCALLNGNPTGYFDGGVHRFNRSGVFFYMSTRNNDFSNRGQKGTWIISAFNSAILWVLAAVLLGVGVAVSAAGLFFIVTGGSASVYYQKFMNKRASFGSHKSLASHRSASGRSNGSHRSKGSKGSGSFGASMI